MAYLELAKQIAGGPPAGTPYSVSLPGTEQEGRSTIYRHWHSKNGLLDTLDPNVRLEILGAKGTKGDP